MKKRRGGGKGGYLYCLSAKVNAKCRRKVSAKHSPREGKQEIAYVMSKNEASNAKRSSIGFYGRDGRRQRYVTESSTPSIRPWEVSQSDAKHPTGRFRGMQTGRYSPLQRNLNTLLTSNIARSIRHLSAL